MTDERGNPLAFRSPLKAEPRLRAALVQYAVAQRPANAELLKQWVTHWNRPSYLSMEALIELFGQAKLRAAHHALLARCGLNMVEI